MDRVERNVRKMIEMGAPAPEIDQYLSTEGLTPEQFRARNLEKPSRGGYLSGLTGAAVDGVSFGLGDEIQALGRAAGDKIADALGIGGEAKEYGGHVSDVRSEQEQFSADNPVSSILAETAGGLGAMKALTTRGVGQAVTRGNMPQALQRLYDGGRVGRAGALAATGGAAGAAYGFGEGDGAEGRAIGALTGGLVGGALGPTVPAVMSGVGSLAKAAAAPVVRRMGTQPVKFSERKLLESLERDGFTPETARKALQSMGPQATIADLGPNTAALADAVTTVPGDALDMATRTFSQRQTGSAQRLSGAAQKGLGAGGNFHGSFEALAAQRQAAAQPLYERAVRPTNVIPRDKFDKVALDEFTKRAFVRAKSDPLYGLSGLPDNSMPVIDAAKRIMDDQINVAKRAGANNRVRLLTEKKNALVAVADEAFPEYAQARAAWSGPSQSMDAMEMGRKFVRDDAEITATELARMSDNDKAFFREGVFRSVRDLLESKDRSANVGRLFNREGFRRKLRIAFGDKEAADEFLRRARLESRFAGTRQTVLGNSRTAMRQEAVADLDAGDPGGLAGIAIDALTGSPVSAGRSVLSMVGERLQRLPEKERNALGKLLFSTRPAENKAALAALERRLQLKGLSQQRVDLLRRVVAAETGMLASPTAP